MIISFLSVKLILYVLVFICLIGEAFGGCLVAKSCKKHSCM